MRHLEEENAPTAHREVRGQLRSFNGSHLILKEQHFTGGYEVTVATSDIVQIKTGRGVWGALRHGFTEPVRIAARPVTDLILAYQMIDAMGKIM